MTPKQVAIDYYGPCKGVNGWCDVHDSMWAYRVAAWCNELVTLIDIAEQAVEGYQADVRAQVEALVTPQGVGSWNSAMEAVLDLIERGDS